MTEFLLHALCILVDGMEMFQILFTFRHSLVTRADTISMKLSFYIPLPFPFIFKLSHIFPTFSQQH
jgi:hypothetical protein